MSETAEVAVPRETDELLNRYVTLLLEENQRQNLIGKATEEAVWERHIADSAQLVDLVPKGSRWADIGSGAGLPGMVIAIISGDPVSLIEPRRLRAEFLTATAAALGLANVAVVAARAQAARGEFDVIAARAVGKIGDLLGISRHLAHKDTTYLLMKGRSAAAELEQARAAWHGRFERIASRTDPDAAIIIARGVAPRGRREGQGRT
jgi:16S rRNA (guanine527-N7)-methyltransferase